MRIIYLKNIVFIVLLMPALCYAQVEDMPQNSILKSFKPFPTPRTNCRPGTVYRIDEAGVNYFVHDVKAVKSNLSDDGTLIGQMTFTRDEVLQCLNLNFSTEYITAEVEIKDVTREYTEQTNVDDILWEKGKVDELIVDPKSSYFIIREAILSKSVTYRFDKITIDKLVTGLQSLKEKKALNDQVIDFPFSIQKTFKEPKRIFYLKQEIGLSPYSDEE